MSYIIHFFGLSTFFWTGLEGVQLHKALVRKKMGDDDGRYATLLRYVIGYGLSLLVVSLALIVTTALDTEDSSHDHNGYCWLRQTTFIWFFVGPATIVICLNLFIMFKSLRVISKAKRRSRDHSSSLDVIKNHLKTWLILNFLLGITWSTGFLMIDRSTVQYTIYIFVVLNGSTGIFIFVYSILYNKLVMTEIKIRLKLVDKGEFAVTYGGDRAQALRRKSGKETSSSFDVSEIRKRSQRLSQPMNVAQTKTIEYLEPKGGRKDSSSGYESSETSSSYASSSSSSSPRTSEVLSATPTRVTPPNSLSRVLLETAIMNNRHQTAVKNRNERKPRNRSEPGNENYM
jgi:hypothetical protein